MKIRPYLPTVLCVFLLVLERIVVLLQNISFSDYLGPLVLVVLFVRGLIFSVLHIVGYYRYSTPSALFSTPSHLDWLIAFLIIIIPLYIKLLKNYCPYLRILFDETSKKRPFPSS